MRKLACMVILAAFLAAACPPVFAEEKAEKNSAENLPWEKASILVG